MYSNASFHPLSIRFIPYRPWRGGGVRRDRTAIDQVSLLSFDRYILLFFFVISFFTRPSSVFATLHLLYSIHYGDIVRRNCDSALQPFSRVCAQSLITKEKCHFSIFFPWKYHFSECDRFGDDANIKDCHRNKILYTCNFNKSVRRPFIESLVNALGL